MAGDNGGSSQAQSFKFEPKQTTVRDVVVVVAECLLAMLIVTAPLAIWSEVEGNTARVRAILVLQHTVSAVVVPGALLFILIISKRVPRPPLFAVKDLRTPGALLSILFGASLCFALTVANLANNPAAKMISYRNWLSLVLVGSPFSLTWTEVILRTVGLCVLTPVAEEWVFRGFLQPTFVRWWGPWAGIAVTALGFTLLQRWSVINLLAMGVFAIVLGLAAHRRQNLTYCILIRAAFNLAALSPGIWRSLVYLKVIGT